MAGYGSPTRGRFHCRHALTTRRRKQAAAPVAIAAAQERSPTSPLMVAAEPTPAAERGRNASHSAAKACARRGEGGERPGGPKEERARQVEEDGQARGGHRVATCSRFAAPGVAKAHPAVTTTLAPLGTSPVART